MRVPRGTLGCSGAYTPVPRAGSATPAVSPGMAKSYQREVTRPGVVDGVNGYRLIESREPATISSCEREKICVGYLAMPVQPRVVDEFGIEQAGRT